MVRLRVRLIEGTNLPAADMLNGRSDPYCLLTLERGGPVMRSRTVMRSLNPRWDDEFVFFFEDDDPSEEGKGGEEALVVTCMDEDRLKRDDFLGSVRIPLSALPAQGGPKWYTLANSRHGELLIEAELTLGGVNPTPTGAELLDAPADSAPSVSSSPPDDVGPLVEATVPPSTSAPPVVALATTASTAAAVAAEGGAAGAAVAAAMGNRYSCFYSRVAGHVTTSLGQSYRRWMCYEVEMRHVARIFGSHVQRWNEVRISPSHTHMCVPKKIAVNIVGETSLLFFLPGLCKSKTDLCTWIGTSSCTKCSEDATWRSLCKMGIRWRSVALWRRFAATFQLWRAR